MKTLKNTLLAVMVVLIIWILCSGKSFYSETNNILFFIQILAVDSLDDTICILPIALPILYIYGQIMLMKREEDTSMKKYIISKIVSSIVIILILFIVCDIFIINLRNSHKYEKYKIDYETIDPVEMCSRTLKDIVNDETIDIKTSNVEIIVHTYMESTLSRRGSSSRSYDVTEYYLDINDEEYVIPIMNSKKAEELFYKNKDGENINIITVHKNSKLIKAINGIDL